MKNIKIISQVFSICFALLLSGSSYAQSKKVVVIPLGADNVSQSLLPVAYGLVNDSGSVRAGALGVTSATRNSTGVYTIVIDQTVLNPAVIAMTFDPSHTGNEHITSSAFNSTNQIQFYIADSSGDPINSAFYFTVFGAGASASLKGSADKSNESPEGISD